MRQQEADGIETRLALALEQNAEVINFNADDPVEAIKHLTGGPGCRPAR